MVVNENIFLKTGLEDGERGFTLIELLIALLMSGIVMAAIYTTTNKQQEIYVDQDQVVAMQDNLRAAMLIMTREIRMAGYDPTGLANAGITATTRNPPTLTFTMDNNGDGDTLDTKETVKYYLQGGDLKRDAPNTLTVAENIANLEFLYTMADGTQTLAPANLADIRAVEITVLAETAVSTSNNIGKTAFVPPFVPPSKPPHWNLAPGFRGRMQTVMVKCRNMGL